MGAALGARNLEERLGDARRSPADAEGRYLRAALLPDLQPAGEHEPTPQRLGKALHASGLGDLPRHTGFHEVRCAPHPVAHDTRQPVGKGFVDDQTPRLGVPAREHEQVCPMEIGTEAALVLKPRKSDGHGGRTTRQLIQGCSQFAAAHEHHHHLFACVWSQPLDGLEE